MPTGETELAMAERHVAEAEEHVTKQLAIIKRLLALGSDTALAESILRELELSLTLAQEHVSRLRA